MYLFNVFNFVGNFIKKALSAVTAVISVKATSLCFFPPQTSNVYLLLQRTKVYNLRKSYKENVFCLPQSEIRDNYF